MVSHTNESLEHSNPCLYLLESCVWTLWQFVMTCLRICAIFFTVHIKWNDHFCTYARKSLDIYVYMQRTETSNSFLCQTWHQQLSLSFLCLLFVDKLYQGSRIESGGNPTPWCVQVRVSYRCSEKLGLVMSDTGCHRVCCYGMTLPRIMIESWNVQA